MQPFPFYVGAMFLMIRFQLIRHCVSSLYSSLSDKLFLVLSNHLCFGLPLLLFHGTSITITLLPTHSSSIPNTCPYQFKLRSCTFLDIYPTFAIPLIRSSLIQSTLVTPLIHLNTLISATYCDLFTAHVHWCLPGFSLLHTYPVLSLHNYMAVPSPYCASRLLDEAPYPTPFLDIYIPLCTVLFFPVSPYVAAPRILHPPPLYLACNQIVSP